MSTSTTSACESAARALFDAMNARDLRPLSDLLASDAVFHFPGTDPLVGPERIARFIGILFKRFPALEFKTGRIIASASCAAVEWTNQGKDRHGALYRNAGVTVLELDAGKIVYLSDTFKDTTLFARGPRS